MAVLEETTDSTVANHRKGAFRGMAAFKKATALNWNEGLVLGVISQKYQLISQTIGLTSGPKPFLVDLFV